jgi:hypothetical protein
MLGMNQVGGVYWEGGGVGGRKGWGRVEGDGI